MLLTPFLPALRVAVAISVLAYAVPAHAVTATAGVSIRDVEIGFAGLYQVGRWTPLSVTVEASQPGTFRVEIHTVDPEGNGTTFPSEEFELTAGEPRRLTVLFQAGRRQSELEIELIAADGSMLERRNLRPSLAAHAPLRPALMQSEAIWATLGSPAGFGGDQAGPQTLTSSFESVVIADLLSAEQLPENSRAYDGLSALVLNGQFQFDERRTAAVRDWVRGGGHLVLALGRHTDAYQKSQLTAWVPVSVEAPKALLLRDLSELEAFAGTNHRIPFSSNMQAARLRTAEGEKPVSGLDSPLVVRVPYGFGKVTVLALELDPDGPLAKWKSIDTVCRRLAADEQPAASQETRGSRSRLSHSGISELASQLYAVQEDFPGINRFPAWKVMGLMLFYLLIIGPADYLLVHRLLKKPRLTWVTFPVFVAAAAVLAMGGATRINGTAMQVNQFDVIDLDEQTGFARCQSWLNIYSPDNRRIAATLQPTGPIGDSDGGTGTSAALCWNGVPENAFGGMYRQAGFDLGRPNYRFSAGATAVEDAPVAVWSTKPLTADWQRDVASLVESQLESPGLGQLTGSVIHHLPVPVDDWIIAYGNRVFRPRVDEYPESARFAPDERWDPNAPSVHQRELRGFLTRARFIKVAKKDRTYGEDILVREDPYDPLDLDPVDLMRMITFHNAAGGTSYTGLANTALARFDLSRMLSLDRAVLFGRIDLPAAEWSLDGRQVAVTRQTAFVRILLPVKGVTAGPRKLPELGDEVIKLQHLKQKEESKTQKRE